MFESTSAPNTTLSDALSPNVSVPPLNVVVPVTVALPATVKLPPTARLPDISAAPFMSIVVAAICISVSATMSSCPSAEELMYIAVSRNRIFSVVSINISSENLK